MSIYWMLNYTSMTAKFTNMGTVQSFYPGLVVFHTVEGFGVNYKEI